MQAKSWLVVIAAIAALAIALGIILRWPAITWGARTARAALLVPIRAIRAGSATVEKAVKFVAAIRNLHRENLSLRAQNLDLRAERTRLAELLRDTEAIRKEFGLPGEVRFQLLAAHIIGRDPQIATANVIIDKGRLDGVFEGSAVLAPGDILVGRVVRADERSATVRALTDPLSSVNVVTEETRTTGIVKGQHGLDLRLELIQPGRELKAEEEVLTSGQDGLFPRGFILGRVSAVEARASGLLTTATIAPAARLDQLELALVVLAAVPF
ncbi:rod shape-determining protein MreC [Candidatus Parcubacteria bacterium]|nr:rod shape-determining protein MreC [Candidatus Parcubacteria bacterium]